MTWGWVGGYLSREQVGVHWAGVGWGVSFVLAVWGVVIIEYVVVIMCP